MNNGATQDLCVRTSTSWLLSVTVTSCNLVWLKTEKWGGGRRSWIFCLFFVSTRRSKFSNIYWKTGLVSLHWNLCLNAKDIPSKYFVYYITFNQLLIIMPVTQRRSIGLPRSAAKSPFLCQFFKFNSLFWLLELSAYSWTSSACTTLRVPVQTVPIYLYISFYI